MAKETIEVQRQFTIGSRNAAPQGGNSPWQEFKRDPLDWMMSTLTIVGTAIVAVVVFAAVFLLPVVLMIVALAK